MKRNSSIILTQTALHSLLFIITQIYEFAIYIVFAQVSLLGFLAFRHRCGATLRWGAVVLSFFLCRIMAASHSTRIDKVMFAGIGVLLASAILAGFSAHTFYNCRNTLYNWHFHIKDLGVELVGICISVFVWTEPILILFQAALPTWRIVVTTYFYSLVAILVLMLHESYLEGWPKAIGFPLRIVVALTIPPLLDFLFCHWTSEPNSLDGPWSIFPITAAVCIATFSLYVKTCQAFDQE